MKKIAKYLLIALCGASVWSCDLATTSPSVVDGEFVFGGIETGRTAILAAYNQLINDYNNGYVPNFTNIGSDIERCSVGNITDLVGGAQLYLEPYDEARFNINFQKGNWDRFYSIIFKCNSIIENIENNPDIESIKSSAPNDLSDLLGQAYCLRASVYYDMTMYYGDVIYIKAAREESKELRSRFAILEDELENLIAVEPLMYQIGSNGHLSDQMTRNFCEGLIGRICFALAGYQTRRTDLGADFYVDKDGKPISFEDWGSDSEKNAAYGRRSDWKTFYAKALPYLKKAVEQPGEAILTTVDPRTDKARTYGNPFQYYFQQINEEYKAPETIYEVTMKEVGGGSRIAYNFGRGSNGASPGLPPKANAQICTFPEVYYGEFDPQDMRRDVSMSVTGSSGTGVEVLYNFNLTNRLTLGVGLNKYDPNRVETPDLRQLNSGVSYIHMRQADIILMLAEAYAQTGDEGSAKAELKKVHDRAFPDDIQDAKFNELLASQPTLVDAILKERQLEFQGENLRRWDLVRSGKLPQIAYEFRKKLVDHMAEMKANGYATFDNGNEFPAYVWTKLVDAKKEYGYRLTTQTPAGKEDDPVLYPGWRGENDDWATVAREVGVTEANIKKNLKAGDMTNLAIKGLFKHIDPESDEAKALEADGYTKVEYGLELAKNKQEYVDNFFKGFDYESAPIYLLPVSHDSMKTIPGLTNGYGFSNK